MDVRSLPLQGAYPRTATSPKPVGRNVLRSSLNLQQVAARCNTQRNIVFQDAWQGSRSLRSPELRKVFGICKKTRDTMTSYRDPLTPTTSWSTLDSWVSSCSVRRGEPRETKSRSYVKRSRACCVRTRIEETPRRRAEYQLQKHRLRPRGRPSRKYRDSLRDTLQPQHGGGRNINCRPMGFVPRGRQSRNVL